MKKLSVFLLTLVFVFAFSACGLFANNTVDKQKNPGSDSAVQSTEGTEQSQVTNSFANNNTDSSSNIQNPTGTNISRDKAIEIALSAAGVKMENVRELEAELDRERSIVVWEVDFESGYTEYSYDINAENGTITERDKEFDD